MPQGDDELVQNACRGDKEAFTELYNRYEAHLYRFVRYLSSNPHLAEELFQDTWLRIAKYFMAQKPVSNFRNLLFTTATNLYRDELRKRRVRTFFLGKEAVSEGYYDGETESATTVPTIDADGENVAIREALNRAMNSLSTKQRAIFVLYYIEGFKISEIAEIVKKAEGTIKATLHTATQKLRKELTEFRE